jgi:hypothetical protein
MGSACFVTSALTAAEAHTGMAAYRCIYQTGALACLSRCEADRATKFAELKRDAIEPTILRAPQHAQVHVAADADHAGEVDL